VTLYLAIDTATDLGSVAVGEPGTARAEIMFSDRRHASVLVPAVEECLRIAGGTAQDLSGILIADGPGSFTGLRIGLATAKGILAVHDSLDLHTAPSLLAAGWIALQHGGGPVAVLYDAYRSEVFGAVYDVDGGAVREVSAPVCCSIDDLIELAEVKPRVAVGDGAVLYAERIREWTGAEPIGPPAGGPRASALLELLQVDGGVTRVLDPDSFVPTYGRQAAAQDRWEETHGRRLPDSPSGRS
jgi:tRNA threonylcarbamoyl adenosine modification protein YeaZ